MVRPAVYTAYYRGYSVKWSEPRPGIVKITTPNYDIETSTRPQLPDMLVFRLRALGWSAAELNQLTDLIFPGSDQPWVSEVIIRPHTPYTEEAAEAEYEHELEQD